MGGCGLRYCVKGRVGDCSEEEFDTVRDAVYSVLVEVPEAFGVERTGSSWGGVAGLVAFEVALRVCMEVPRDEDELVAVIEEELKKVVRPLEHLREL